jgi:hypothetical protein
MENGKWRMKCLGGILLRRTEACSTLEKLKHGIGEITFESDFIRFGSRYS